jgi:dihydroneopterin aldolase
MRLDAGFAGVVAQRAHHVIVGEPCQLIETVATRIVDACADVGPLQFMEVAVHKPSAPIAVPFDDVVVRVRREFG